MSLLRETIAALGYRADNRIDQLTEKIERRWQQDEPLRIIPYYGFGTSGQFRLQGRILQGKHLAPQTNTEPTDAGDTASHTPDSMWDNLHKMYHRFASDEVADVLVEGAYQGEIATAQSNEEGYFQLTFTPEQPLSVTTELWHSLALRVANDSLPATQQPPVTATGHVLIPPPSSNFGIISDIDDTVLQTNATNLLKMARVVFLNSAHTRLPFKGVAAFYSALHHGSSGNDRNPVFYVSSSPWNLYDLLVEFMTIHGIPTGPLFLQDYGLDPGKLITTSHEAHKVAAIEQILLTYPDLPFILIGDSGQADPEIYLKVLNAFPEQIRAIYIRDVSDHARDRDVQALIQEAQARQVDMLLVPDTQAAADHAYANGLIEARELRAVEAGRAKDAAAPSDFEVLLEQTTGR